MAPRNSNTNGSIPAVAYYRMSSDKQEASIPEQREAVERYAADHGYRIVREYIDEGISGDKTSKRKGFLQMHQDACNAGDFTVILCWNQDRFGRFDSMEAGFYIHPLREAGISLVTVTEGPIDWNDFTGRVMSMLKTETNHQFLRSLSANVSRGLLAKAQRGEWTQGRPPLGYAVDANDRLIFGHTDEVRLVKRIFRQYLKGGSLNDLATKLNLEGIRTRRGCKWHRSAIREILERQLYVGDFVWNGESNGSYSSIRGGKVTPTAGDGSPNDESDRVIIRDNHPAIIDRDTYEAVQQRLRSRNKGGSGVRSSNPHRYVLTGLLRCAKCGSQMFGSTKRNHQYFGCGGYLSFGVSHCDRNSVRQDRILQLIVASIQHEYTNPATMKRIRTELECQAEQRPDTCDSVRQASRIQNQIEALDQKIAKAQRRLALCEDDVYADVSDVLRSLKADRAGLSTELATTKRAQRGQILAPGERVEKAMELFNRLADAFQQADQGMVRDFLLQSIDRVDLTVDKRQWGERYRYDFRKGVIHFAGSENIGATLTGTPRRTVQHSVN